MEIFPIIKWQKALTFLSLEDPISEEDYDKTVVSGEKQWKNSILPPNIQFYWSINNGKYFERYCQKAHFIKSKS